MSTVAFAASTGRLDTPKCAKRHTRSFRGTVILACHRYLTLCVSDASFFCFVFVVSLVVSRPPVYTHSYLIHEAVAFNAHTRLWYIAPPCQQRVV